MRLFDIFKPNAKNAPTGLELCDSQLTHAHSVNGIITVYIISFLRTNAR